MNVIIKDDFAGLTRTIKALGKVPQKCASRAAMKAANLVLRATRSAAPYESGILQGAIVRKGEKSRYKGKKVFQVTFDSAYNSDLQKPIKNPGMYGGKSTHAYVPASMEYGFKTRANGQRSSKIVRGKRQVWSTTTTTDGNGLPYVPGLHFMRSSAEENSAQSEKLMLDTFSKEVYKEWNKTHGNT